MVIQPENILCQRQHDGSMFVKIADFGLSKSILDDPTTRCGSDAYMAPEVFARHGVYDQKCDVWSFGCIIFEMLTCTVPFLPCYSAREHFDFCNLQSLIGVSLLGLFFFSLHNNNVLNLFF